MAQQTRLRIGTRASALARWQAEWTARQLSTAGIETELVLITTEGDVKSGPIGKIGGQGLFTKRIQQALLADEIDLAVHSLKDLPTDPVERLTLAVVPKRESVNDVLVSNKHGSLNELPDGALIGTGSLRRRAQLLHHRTDLKIADIRGNVDTRLRKLDDGQYDAIVLAQAGLTRLGLAERITELIPAAIMLPAIGQGALGMECRDDDDQTINQIQTLNDNETHCAVVAERSLLASLRGGCLAPIGAGCRVENEKLLLEAVVLNADGTRRLNAQQSGALNEAASIGQQVAERLLENGAADLISAARQGK